MITIMTTIKMIINRLKLFTKDVLNTSNISRFLNKKTLLKHFTLYNILVCLLFLIFTTMLKFSSITENILHLILGVVNDIHNWLLSSLFVFFSKLFLKFMKEIIKNYDIFMLKKIPMTGNINYSISKMDNQNIPSTSANAQGAQTSTQGEEDNEIDFSQKIEDCKARRNRIQSQWNKGYISTQRYNEKMGNLTQEMVNLNNQLRAINEIKDIDVLRKPWNELTNYYNASLSQYKTELSKGIISKERYDEKVSLLQDHSRDVRSAWKKSLNSYDLIKFRRLEIQYLRDNGIITHDIYNDFNKKLDEKENKAGLSKDEIKVTPNIANMDKNMHDILVSVTSKYKTGPHAFLIHKSMVELEYEKGNITSEQYQENLKLLDNQYKNYNSNNNNN